MVPPPSPLAVATPPKKLPKAVVQAREVLLAKGVSLDGLDAKQLYASLEPKQVNALASGFRGAMAPEAKQGYASMAVAERREWLAQYVLDPETGANHGFSETRAVNSRKTVRPQSGSR